MTAYHAKRSGRWLGATGTVLFGLVVLWAQRHIISYVGLRHGHTHTLTLLYGVSFAVLGWQVLAYLFERPYTTTERQNRRLYRLRVVVNVPVCNEDPQALQNCLLSLARQTRSVQQVQVVVNGPNKVNYTTVEAFAKRLTTKSGLAIDWVTQEIAGKRHAQARTARAYLQPGDILLTVDSDAYLDSKAVEEGLKPFADRRVQSVAGVVLTMNNRASFLTRMSDLLFQTWQLTDRSAGSVFGAVLVNSGVLAFYRAQVLLNNLDSYTNETFFGRPVQFSDDSMLTLYALEHGKAVQQPTCFGFTLMPENVSHHLRQQVRWMRGSFIRSWWRLKYLPLDSYAYWSHLLRWAQVILSSFTFLYVFVHTSLLSVATLPYLLVIPLAIGYAQALRYFTVSRSDESFWYRLGTYVCWPVPGLWSFFVLRVVRWYGMATCLKTGWGTRSSVEVGVTNN